MSGALEPSWFAQIGREFDQPYMVQLRAFLVEQKKAHRVFPPGSEMFNAFNHTPFDKVRVVILGQDPYHGFGQAHGLCFSVRRGTPIPPSLLNIYKELQADLGIERAPHGELTAWADQGVLLLNAVLSVREDQANSHQNQGWERFTDRAVEALAERREGVVFVLWGAAAMRKAARIDRDRHFVIASPHPSPLSADRGFFGSRPFSKINAYLRERGEAEIDWRIR